MKKLLLLFTLIFTCSSSYAADSAEQSSDSLSYYEMVKKNVLLIAEHLPSYDSLYICALDNDDYVIVTDSALYEDGDFDGLYTLVAHVNSDNIIEIKEGKPNTFGFSKNIFKYIGKGELENFWKTDSHNRPYSAIIERGKIVYEHMLPIICVPSFPLSEEDEIISFMILYWVSNYDLFHDNQSTKK